MDRNIFYRMFSSSRNIVVFMLLLIAVVSCENDIDEVDKIVKMGTAPQEELQEVTIVYSDSGYTRAVLISPRLQKFDNPKEEKILFPEGLDLTFYKPGKQAESKMTALYGALDIREKELVLKNNVVFINFTRQDTINTEQLNWSQDSSKVFTDKVVYIKGKDGVFKSHGMTSNESFTNYKFFNVSGIANIEMNEPEE